MMYDYIIVGAGPAGCVCAGELKRKNYSVCVLEKQPEHYRKVCGDGISYVCVQALRSIDFPIESLMDAGAVKIQRCMRTGSEITGKKHMAWQEIRQTLLSGNILSKTETYLFIITGTPGK